MSSSTVAGDAYCLSLVSASEEPVSAYYVALCYTEPGIATAGSELDEPEEEAGYVRAVIYNESGNWEQLHNQLSNAEDVDFTVASADWGLVRYWAITDEATGGRVFWTGSFTEPLYVGEGEQVSIPAGGLDIYFGEAL